jgi:hypothetical protein
MLETSDREGVSVSGLGWSRDRREPEWISAGRRVGLREEFARRREATPLRILPFTFST